MISLDLSVEAKGWRRSKLVYLAYSGNSYRPRAAGTPITDYTTEVDRVVNPVNDRDQHTNVRFKIPGREDKNSLQKYAKQGSRPYRLFTSLIFQPKNDTIFGTGWGCHNTPPELDEIS